VNETPNPSAAGPKRRTEVFFDGSCPLCRREIDFYRKSAGADEVIWTDVSACARNGTRPADDLDPRAAMKRFHIRDNSGRLVSGAEAFAGLWRALPRWRWAGRIAGVWGIRHALEFAYRCFLLVRPIMQSLARRAEERVGRSG